MSFSFGAAPAAAPAPASTGFSFGAAAPAAAASSGFSFGAAAPAAPAAASSGFSFGAAPAAAPAASSTGFSFGAAPAAAPAASTGFSFGGAPAATPAASSGFSFGAAPAAAPAASTGFGFGAAAPSASPTGFGFGATAPAPSTGFGFGTAAPAASPTGFGFGAAAPGAFGTAAPAAAAAAPPAPAITLETVFEALPADVQKNMALFHAFLREQDAADALLKAASPKPLEQLAANLARLEQDDVLARRNAQARQQGAVAAVRQDVRRLLHQVDTASLSLRSLDSTGGGGAGGAGGLPRVLRRVEMPSAYYWDLLDHFERKMAGVKAQIEDVEALGGRAAVSAAMASPSMQRMDGARLQQLLVAQNAALMQVAARVAEAHEQAEALRQLFLARLRRDLERHGEKNPAAFKNPFDKRRKSGAAGDDQAIDAVRFRTNVAPTIVAAPSAAPAGVPASPAVAPAATGFGFGTASTPSLFGTSTTAAAATTATSVTAATPATTGFGFSTAPSTAPVAGAAGKQVTFNLGVNTGAASPTTVASPTTSAFSFGAPAAGGFGGISSSFVPGATDAKTTGAKRTGRMQKKRS